MGVNTIRMLAAIGGVASAAHASAIDYRGLDHQPVGVATLVVDSSDQLVVSPIPGGGSHGASIDLGDAEFWHGSLVAFDTGAPSGAWLNFDVTGVVGGSPTAFAEVRLTDTAGRVFLSASYPIATGFPIDVTVYNGSSVVASATNVGGFFAVLDPEGYVIDPVEVLPTELRSTISFDAPTVIDLIGQPTATGDRIEISAAAAITYDSLASVELTGSDLGSFTIRDELLGKFGYALRALGQATLDAAGVCPSCMLTLGNIGATGDDGVRVNVVNGEALEQTWHWRDPSSIPDGAVLRIAAVGTLHAVPGIEFASIAFEDIGADLAVRTEFAGVGATSRTVAVFNGGALVGQVTGQTSAIAAMLDDEDWPRGLTADARVADFGGHTGFIARWDAAVTIAITGGPTVVGDKLAVVGDSQLDVPLDIAAVPDYVEGIPVLQFIFIGQEESCPGDVDGDDDIDLGDLAQLLANFGQTPADAADGDFDDSDEVDLTDLAMLLSAFDTTCN